jgi:cbb3-type cytochrome oxidase subunit 3
MSTIACGLLLIGIFFYVFYPERRVEAQPQKTRLDFLRERKESVYDNLRDLNFEYRAGKYPEEDYAAQRAALENEAAEVLAEIDLLEKQPPATQGLSLNR